MEYLRSFIELQKLRSSDRLKLHVDFEGSLNGQQVYPLLFLPLVENAFKYVGGDFEIHIEAGKSDDGISFRVQNSIPDKAIRIKTGGIGLENLRRRLELLYPASHEFVIEEKDNRFIATLKLKTITY
jgi:LytS/YehU family sensor histidine kinase